MISTPAPLDVELNRVYTPESRMDPVQDAYNLEVWMHENQLENIISSKVDEEMISAAFQYGVREALGEGPPFAATDSANHVLDIQVVNWGLEVIGWRSPAVFAYKVRVVGYKPGGKVFYRSTFRCYGDAGPVRWLQTTLSSGTHALEQIDAAVVQQSFDRAANLCGAEFAEKLRTHSGFYDGYVEE